MNPFKTIARAPLTVIGAVFAVLAVMLLFFAHPCSHVAHGVILGSTGAVLPELEFQQKVLKGVETLTAENASLKKSNDELKSSYQKVLDDLSRADKEVKKAAEDIVALQKNCNDITLMSRALEKQNKSIHRNANSSFGDPIKRLLADDETRAFFNAVARSFAATATGSRLDPAFSKIIEDANAKHKSLTGVDSGLGQATVPTETFNQIYDTLLEYGQWPTLGVMRVGMRTVILPVATSRPQYYWLGSGTGGQGEGSTITAGAFGGSSVTLIIQTLATYLTVTRELLADSTVDLAPYIVSQMTQSIAQGLDTAAFIGTGTADQISAGYYGIFNAAGVNANMAATSAQGNTTVAGTQLDDWENVLNTVNPEVLTRNPKWWMHPQILAKTVLVRDKNGRPIFQSWIERPDMKAVAVILGSPVIRTNIAPNTDGPGSVIAAFGDSDGQAVAIREDLEIATSADIAFPQNMMAYRALMRAGIKTKSLANSTTLVPLANLTLSPN